MTKCSQAIIVYAESLKLFSLQKCKRLTTKKKNKCKITCEFQEISSHLHFFPKDMKTISTIMFSHFFSSVFFPSRDSQDNSKKICVIGKKKWCFHTQWKQQSMQIWRNFQETSSDLHAFTHICSIWGLKIKSFSICFHFFFKSIKSNQKSNHEGNEKKSIKESFTLHVAFLFFFSCT